MTVVVSTPSRLHFGLLRFEQADGPSFGGLGMMIASPRWVIEVSRAENWVGEGPGVERALTIARRVLEQSHLDAKPPALRLRVTSLIPEHRGFGGGTQLALAVAAATRQLLGLPPASASELATLAGRGQRSAVGTHGFLHGGLVWETGREPGEPLGRLAARVALPEPWRIVLVGSPEEGGLSGKPESEAFRALPRVPAATTKRLQQLAVEQILPAAQCARIDIFGEAVYEYGRLSGECFAPVQGGPYASESIAQCVQTIRDLGVSGVGQSSWGPSVFSLAESLEQAESLVQSLKQRLPSNYSVEITAPDNRGAVIASKSTVSSFLTPDS
jgi:beta-RFAP synthase